MAKTLEFLFDFGSPNVYLAWKALPPILRRTGASLQVTPILLGGLFKLTDNRSPVEAFAGVKGKLAYENMETQRFVARHGLSAFRMNPHFPVNTLLIQRGLVAAGRAGVAEAYREAVLAAMWEQGLKMDDPAVVAAYARAHDLEPSMAEARGRLLGALLRLGRTEEASEISAAAVDRRDDDPLAWTDRSSVQRAAGDLQGAQEASPARSRWTRLWAPRTAEPCAGRPRTATVTALGRRCDACRRRERRRRPRRGPGRSSTRPAPEGARPGLEGSSAAS